MSVPGIPDETINEIRDRSDIVAVVDAYVPLKKQGADFWACCPFHQEKTPSFKVSPTRQAFYCFGCKKGGNVFHFVMEQEGVDFVTAVRLLAQRCGVRIPEPSYEPGGPSGEERQNAKELALRLLSEVASWYRGVLNSSDGEKGRAYLAKRGLPPDVIAAFGLGYSPDSWDAAMNWGRRHGYSEDAMIAAGMAVPREEQGGRGCYDRFRGRLMFPVWDELGRIVGFSARTLDPDAKTAKYVNTPETAVFHKGRLLYALHLARQALKESGGVLVCEGQLDVIACHRAGLTHAVAPQGTAFTETHAALVRRYTQSLTLAFDADAAGQSAAVRSLQVAVQAGLGVRVVTLPPGADPDTLYRERGEEGVREAMEAVQEGFDFLLDLTRGRHDANSPDGKAAVVREVLETVSMVSDPVARAARCQWLSRELSLPEEAVFESLRQRINRQRRVPRPAGPRSEPRPAPRAPPAETGPIERAKLMLLDLALHHGFIAHQMAEHYLPHDSDLSPASRALGLVLEAALHDQWHTAADAVAADEDLARDPQIARILVTPEFPPLAHDEADEAHRKKVEERLLKAMQDCLGQLEGDSLAREIAAVERALTTATDRDARRELLGGHQVLARRKARV